MDARMIKSINLRKLRLAGLLPGHFDGANNKSNIADLINKIPFSKNYKTYLEYKADSERAQRFMLNGKEIPDNLINKLRETGIEIGLVDE